MITDHVWRRYVHLVCGWRGTCKRPASEHISAEAFRRAQRTR